MSSDLTMRLQRCRRVLAASRDGYWERDLRSSTVWYSESFYTMFGLRPGAAGLEEGLVEARVHPKDQARFREAYRRAVAHCGDFDYEMRFLDGAGHWRWVRGRGQVWADADGKPEFISGACTDVNRERIAMSALEQQARQLEAQVHERTQGLAEALRLADDRRVEAERANAAKSRYLTHISHEIRTPLSAMLALSELALRGAHSPDQRRYLEQALLSGEALQLMVSDVLDLARIESGRLELRPRDFDLGESLAATLRALMPLARQRELSLLFDHSGSEARVHADEAALRQIVTNLVGNAIKYSPNGQVRLTAETRRVDGGQTALELDVADDGPGIAGDRQATIFEPFVQGSSPHDAGAGSGGAGMGLAIAQGLARAMGGSVTLHCPPTGGSVFRLSVVLPSAEQAAAPELPRTPGLAWVVNPEAANGVWLQHRMERQGWQCALLPDLATAVAQARADNAPRPDVVLLIEPAVHLGSNLRPLRQALPDAVLRLVIRPDWHAPLLEAQARSLQVEPLVAPLSARQLRGLGRTAAADATAAVADAAAVVAADTPGTAEAAGAAEAASDQAAGGEVLLVEDNEVNQLVGREFLQALGLRVRLARDGRQAIAACAEHSPSLVLMDLNLPDMDGRVVTERLRSMQREGQWCGAPILALTAFATQDDQALCHAAGMNGVLTKPLSLDVLRRELQRWQLPTT